jgi:hypothetical protein
VRDEIARQGQRHAARVPVEQPVGDAVVVAVEFDALDDAPAVRQFLDLAFIELVALDPLDAPIGAVGVRLPDVSDSPPTTTSQPAVFWKP